MIATSTTLNTVDTIVACSGVLYFSGGRIGFFDAGCTRSYYTCTERVNLTLTLTLTLHDTGTLTLILFGGPIGANMRSWVTRVLLELMIS